MCFVNVSFFLHKNPILPKYANEGLSMPLTLAHTDVIHKHIYFKYKNQVQYRQRKKIKPCIKLICLTNVSFCS